MIKSKMTYLLFVAAAAPMVTVHKTDAFGLRMHNAWLRHMENFWRDFDAQFDKEWESLPVRDEEAVQLPEVSIKKENDTVLVALKGLKLKEAEIKGEYDEENDYAQYTLPQADSTVTVRIYPRGISVTGEKKITEEKKDPTGKVLASSTYSAYNSVSERFPVKVNISKITREYKDGMLTLKLPSRQIKRAI